MIKKINHKTLNDSEAIYGVFQDSYKIEANLLGISFRKFPPLNRSPEDFQESITSFYGYYKAAQLVAVVELDGKKHITHICSLVVSPSCFRQGIANKLLEFATTIYNSGIITVETGLKNTPAITLYERLGFKLQGQYRTAIGVEKVQFLLKLD